MLAKGDIKKPMLNRFLPTLAQRKIYLDLVNGRQCKVKFFCFSLLPRRRWWMEKKRRMAKSFIEMKSYVDSG